MTLHLCKHTWTGQKQQDLWSVTLTESMSTKVFTSWKFPLRDRSRKRLNVNHSLSQACTWVWTCMYVIYTNTNFKPGMMKSLMRSILSNGSRRKDYYGMQRDLTTGMGANTHRGEPWACLKYIPLYTQVLLHSLVVTRGAAVKYIFCLFCFKNETTPYNGIHSVVSILLMSSTESMRLLIRNLWGEASKHDSDSWPGEGQLRSRGFWKVSLQKMLKMETIPKRWVVESSVMHVMCRSWDI